jgi:hypothetical protein
MPGRVIWPPTGSGIPAPAAVPVVVGITEAVPTARLDNPGDPISEAHHE